MRGNNLGHIQGTLPPELAKSKGAKVYFRLLHPTQSVHSLPPSNAGEHGSSSFDYSRDGDSTTELCLMSHRCWPLARLFGPVDRT